MQSNRHYALVTGAILAGLLAEPSTPGVSADSRRKEFSARLSSFNEVMQTLSTPGRGSFRAKLSKDGSSVSYRLTVSGLIDVRQAHIHFGKSKLNGGIMVWLCQTPPAFTDPSGTSPTCVDEGTVEGTLKAENIIGPGGQGISAGEFDAFLEALREDAGYVNVHTVAFPGGEIRGQVKVD